MTHSSFSVVALTLIGSAVVAAGLRADDELGPRPREEVRCPHPQDVLQDLPSGCHTDSRAGYACSVAWYAHPSDTGAYIGYSVGGGCAVSRRARSTDEGTWGWDYRGVFLPRRVVLGWCRCPSRQGGIGYYRTVPRPDLSSPTTP
jgi:hypothetical protein